MQCCIGYAASIAAIYAADVSSKKFVRTKNWRVAYYEKLSGLRGGYVVHLTAVKLRPSSYFTKTFLHLTV